MSALANFPPEPNYEEFKIPYQEGVISEMYQRPDRSYFQESPQFDSLINTGKLIEKCLPKQADIDKMLKIILRNVLKGTHVPVAVKEIQIGYMISPYFKDLYLYLAQNKLHSTKTAIYKVEALVEKYILLESLLFKLVTTPKKETTLLAIPKICANKIITLYHSCLFAGHQGIIKTYLTIGDNFFIPGLILYLWLYIKGCHIYQLSRNDKLPMRQLQTRINLNYRP